MASALRFSCILHNAVPIFDNMSERRPTDRTSGHSRGARTVSTERRSIGSSHPRKWVWTAVLIACLAAYVLGKPYLERWLGRPLPSLTGTVANVEPRAGAEQGTGTEPSTVPNEQATTKRGTFPPDTIGNQPLTSPAGLVYGIGPNREHRIGHVLRHLQDAPERAVHSVFMGDKYQVFAWIDDAYIKLQQRDPRVVTDERQGNRRQITIDMGQVIGFEGGRRGRESGHPRLTHLRLILDDNNLVVTAYPVSGD